MKIVAISDTHALHARMTQAIPEGDILIHSGDLTDIGALNDVKSFADWSKDLPFKHKIIIAGNHDFCFDPDSPRNNYIPNVEEYLTYAGWIYLFDSEYKIGNIKIYGSPWQPWFYDWAFNKKRGQELADIWAKIPEDTDILITHGPPYGILDQTFRGEKVGCEDLLRRIKQIKPKIHIFGHIHEDYGIKQSNGTMFMNSSICNLSYQPINKPLVVDL
jgi:Icc-related predicted phosphoesterase